MFDSDSGGVFKKAYKYAQLNEWRRKVCESNLDKTTKCILLVMSVMWMDEDLFCFPSQRSIADMVGCTPRTVNTHIKKAQDAGWLRIEEKTGAKQGWRRNDYYGLLPN